MAKQIRITDVSVATIQGQLPAPVIFGDWVMKVREFVVVRMRTRFRATRAGPSR